MRHMPLRFMGPPVPTTARVHSTPCRLGPPVPITARVRSTPVAPLRLLRFVTYGTTQANPATPLGLSSFALRLVLRPFCSSRQWLLSQWPLLFGTAGRGHIGGDGGAAAVKRAAAREPGAGDDHHPLRTRAKVHQAAGGHEARPRGGLPGDDQ
eukprot:1193822-Prorocentrum_minimum.AAC.4